MHIPIILELNTGYRKTDLGLSMKHYAEADILGTKSPIFIF